MIEWSGEDTKEEGVCMSVCRFCFRSTQPWLWPWTVVMMSEAEDEDTFRLFSFVGKKSKEKECVWEDERRVMITEGMWYMN